MMKRGEILCCHKLIPLRNKALGHFFLTAIVPSQRHVFCYILLFPIEVSFLEG